MPVVWQDYHPVRSQHRIESKWPTVRRTERHNDASKHSVQCCRQDESVDLIGWHYEGIARREGGLGQDVAMMTFSNMDDDMVMAPVRFP